MKKLLLTLAAAVSVFAASAQTETSTTLDFGANQYGCPVYDSSSSGSYLPNNTTFTDGDVTIKCIKGTGSGVRFWKAQNVITFRVNNSSSIEISTPDSYFIQSIVLTGQNLGAVAAENGYDGNGTWTATEGQNVTSVTLKNTVKSAQGKNQTLIMNTMVVTYVKPAGTVTKSEPNLAFSATEVTGKVGTPFDAPKLTKDTDAPATYSSSNPEAATVDPTTGEVTLVAQGTTTITATTPATADFLAGEASYTLTVTEDFPRVVVSTSLTSNLNGWDATSSDADITVWNWDANYNCAKASGYIGGVKNAVEGSITSPAIDLSGYWDGQVVFDQAYKFFNNAAQTYLSASVSVDGGDFVPATVTNWPATEDFTWAKSVIDLSAYYGHSVKVKFTYTSTTDVAGTWEIKNFTVKGRVAVAGTTEVEAADADAPATYYNMQGQPVNNPTNGLYIKVQGNKATKVIL